MSIKILNRRRRFLIFLNPAADVLFFFFSFLFSIEAEEEPFSTRRPKSPIVTADPVILDAAMTGGADGRLSSMSPGPYHTDSFLFFFLFGGRRKSNSLKGPLRTNRS